jgi:hypothetical protein
VRISNAILSHVHTWLDWSNRKPCPNLSVWASGQPTERGLATILDSLSNEGFNVSWTANIKHCYYVDNLFNCKG